MACWDCLCCFTVRQSEVRIIEKLGKFDRVANPGCNCYNCFTESALNPFSMRYQYINVHVASMTKDKVHIEVEVCVHYRVKTSPGAEASMFGGEQQPSPAGGDQAPLIPEEQGMDANQRQEAYVKKAFYALSQPHQQISSWTESLVRGQVPEYTVDGMYASRERIARDLQRLLEDQVRPFGYTVYTVLLTNIQPSRDTKESMNAVNKEARLREVARYQADADAKARVLHAEAEAEAQHQSGIGLAEQRKAVVQGLQESIQGFHDAVADVDSKEVMMLLLMNQYFDTLKEIAEKSFTTSVFTPTADGTTSRLRDGSLQATAAHEHGIGAGGQRR